MVIVIQYSKTSTRNSYDTLIPHVFDVFYQDIIKIVTFVTYSFTEQISRVFYSNYNDITVL